MKWRRAARKPGFASWTRLGAVLLRGAATATRVRLGITRLFTCSSIGRKFSSLCTTSKPPLKALGFLWRTAERRARGKSLQSCSDNKCLSTRVNNTLALIEEVMNLCSSGFLYLQGAVLLGEEARRAVSGEQGSFCLLPFIPEE